MQVSYSELRQHLKGAIQAVTDTHEPTVITSHNKPAAVLLAYDDYCALEETAYLLRSPANAKRLLEAVLDLQKGDNQHERSLLDDEA